MEARLSRRVVEVAPGISRVAPRRRARRAGRAAGAGGRRPPAALPADPLLLAGRGLGGRFGAGTHRPAPAADLLHADRLDPAAARGPAAGGAGAVPPAAAGLRRGDRATRLDAGPPARALGNRAGGGR